MFNIRKSLTGLMTVVIISITQLNATECVSTEVGVNSSTMGSWDVSCNSTHRDSYAQFYTFTLDTEMNVEINLNSTVDTYLYLLSDDNQSGTILQENDDYIDLNSRISILLPAGIYTIETSTFSPMSEGDFDLTLISTSPPIVISGVIVLPDNYSNASLDFYNNIQSYSTNTYNDNGSITYGFLISEGDKAEIETSGLNLNIQAYNGNQSFQIAYRFGLDNTVGGIGDNADKVLNDYVNAEPIILDFSAPLPSVDINLSDYTVLSGNVSLPDNYDNASLDFYNSIQSYSTNTYNDNGSITYGFLISEEDKAEIETSGLNLNIQSYNGNESFQIAYSFGLDNAVGGTGDNSDRALRDDGSAEPIILDFSTFLPSIDINLSDFNALSMEIVGQTKYFINESGSIGERTYGADGNYTGSITLANGTVLIVSGTYTIVGNIITHNRTSPTLVTVVTTYLGYGVDVMNFTTSINGAAESHSYLFNTAEARDTSDLDSDGFTDLEEYQAGTDATDTGDNPLTVAIMNKTTYFINSTGTIGNRNYVDDGTYTGTLLFTNGTLLPVDGNYEIVGKVVTLTRSNGVIIVLTYISTDEGVSSFTTTVNGGEEGQSLLYDTQAERDAAFAAMSNKSNPALIMYLLN